MKDIDRQIYIYEWYGIPNAVVSKSEECFLWSPVCFNWVVQLQAKLDHRIQEQYLQKLSK